MLPVNIILSEMECRPLAPIVEKETTTSEYHALSLNALIPACNQKSNHGAVMNLDEDAVRDALHSLKGPPLIRLLSSAESHVVQGQGLAAGPTESFDGTAVD